MIHLCWTPLYHACTTDVVCQERQLISGEFSKSTVKVYAKGLPSAGPAAILVRFCVVSSCRGVQINQTLEAEPDVHVKQAFDRYLFPSVTSLSAQCGLEKVHGA